LVIGPTQQDLGAPRNPEWGLTIPQECMQSDFILGFQLEFARLAI